MHTGERPHYESAIWHGRAAAWRQSLDKHKVPARTRDREPYYGHASTAPLESAMQKIRPCALRLSAAAVFAILFACAGPAPVTLHQMKARQISTLAMACYHENEGTRVAIGGLETWVACKSWAQRQLP